MIDLPPEALAEIERVKASSGASRSPIDLPPEALAEIQGIKQQKMVKNEGSQLLSKIQSIMQGITGGIASAGAKTALGAASLLPDTAGPGLFGEGINRLSKSGETPKQAMTADLQPIIDAFNKKFGDSSLAQGFSGAVEALPYLAGPGEAELPQGLASLASKAPRGLQTLTKLGTGTLKAAPLNAAYGAASYNPDKSTPEKALQGALIGTAVKGAFSGLTGLASSASNTSRMILDALKTLKEEGVPITASDVLGEGSILENFQKNFLPNFIGSGQGTKFKNVINKVKGKGGEVINKLLGNEDMKFVLDNVISRIKQRFSQATKTKNALYGNIDDYINKNNISYDDPLTQKAAKQQLRGLRSAVSQEGRLLANPELEGILEDLGRSPKEIKIQSIEDKVKSGALGRKQANDILKRINGGGKSYKYSKAAKGKLYQLMDEATDPYTIGAYSELYNARLKDLNNIAEKNGDKTLKKLIDKADNYYKNNMAKYRDEDVRPFLYDAKTPHEAFKTFVKSSVTENPKFLEKFTKLLDPTDKSRIAAYMFKDAINKKNGSFKIGKFEQIWSSIGDRTKDLLFNPEDRKALTRLSDLSSLSRTARNAMETPNTGVVNLRGGATLASLTSASNALRDLMTGNLHGAAMWGLPFAAAPIAQEVINNPAFLKAIALMKQAEEKGLLKKSGAGALTNIGVRQ